MVVRMDLRVHAGAPSSRKDDDRFAAQAEAYINFQATRTHSLLAPKGFAVSQVVHQSFTDDADQVARQIAPNDRTMPPPPSSANRDETTVMTWDPTIFLEETQLGYSALESQLITSALSVSKAPHKLSARKQTPVRRRISRQDNLLVSETFDKGPGRLQRQPESTPAYSSPQVPSQSSYLKSPVLDWPSKKARVGGHPILQTPGAPSIPAQSQIRSSEQDGQSESAQDGHDHGNPSSKHLEKVLQQSEEASTGNDTTSELPTSYSLSNITTDSPRSGQRSVQRSTSDPGPLTHDSLHATRDLDRLENSSEQPSSSGRPNIVLEQRAGPYPSEQAEKPQCVSPIAIKDFATAIRVPLKATTASNIVEDEARVLLAELPDMIMPPSPAVSVQSLGSHVTHALRLLADKPDIASKYELVTQARDIRDTERGYWSLDITTWSVILQLDFFRFLTRMIGEGRVGWGAWCVREADDANRILVRVYCWGEIARHMYLLLYAASKSKIRRLGLQWIDAEGEVVVQMRGSDPG